ncbi:tRNA (adenosine(37)-N6)-threonylcarbamoyltransferase complex dimerization subunit type 1 TsaB [Stakelama sediminis]|uniref:tRNA threonylcarbamoyl adenosine modification protein YeaZ n=1 Tax=Stakelama sediminis TaxID=463200 RepID=A0A840YWT9_9SPHN|nr:tRNA (adenosine(37)-N6)-threonylcarbamoyltransferase complex dimerization subunit type 1 TsaB [Stakelama sediminis]MBB5718191.1 tRNA threonylcarbamoyl adenosine modification protein YeaZ [Stakelama sediminis]
MRTLVLDTATAACSVALIEDGHIVDARHDVVGRGHAEHLLPMVAELAESGRADAILVDCGPGSFTGVRVGIAAARGLGLGWEVPVHGYSSLPLLAAAHFSNHPDCEALAVVLEGGHGEVFMQHFATSPFRTLGDLSSQRPDAALITLGELPAIGSGVRHLTALDSAVHATEALPRAVDALLLPTEFVRLAPRPIYGRAPDAKPKP